MLRYFFNMQQGAGGAGALLCNSGKLLLLAFSILIHHHQQGSTTAAVFLACTMLANGTFLSQANPICAPWQRNPTAGPCGKSAAVVVFSPATVPKSVSWLKARYWNVKQGANTVQAEA